MGLDDVAALLLQVDGDGGDLVAGDEGLHGVGRIIECGDGLFSFLVAVAGAVAGADAKNIDVQHEQQNLDKPRGRPGVYDLLQISMICLGYRPITTRPS